MEQGGAVDPGRGNVAALRPASLAQPGSGSRDLRFDLLRGFAMLSVVAAHLESFSWFNSLFRERFGLIPAAEIFVVTASLVNRRVAERDGLRAVTERLLRRSFVLWRVWVAAVLLILVPSRASRRST